MNCLGFALNITAKNETTKSWHGRDTAGKMLIIVDTGFGFMEVRDTIFSTFCVILKPFKRKIFYKWNPQSPTPEPGRIIFFPLVNSMHIY